MPYILWYSVGRELFMHQSPTDAVLHADLGVEQAQIVVDLRGRGHGGLGTSPGESLFDRHSGRDAENEVDLGLVHHVDVLPGIGGKALDESALALGKQNIEGKGALARAGEAGDDNELVSRNVDIQILEIVVPGAGDLYGVAVRLRTRSERRRFELRRCLLEVARLNGYLLDGDLVQIHFIQPMFVSTLDQNDVCRFHAL